METLRFNYDLEFMTCTYGAHGAEIKIQYNDQFEVECIEVSGVEYEAGSDLLYYLYVKTQHRGEFVRISYIIVKANELIERLHSESITEQDDEEAMARHLSSPQATGRI